MSIPDKVIAAMAQPLHNVGLIILSTDHDDGHHSIRHCLAQLCAELMSCRAQAYSLSLKSDCTSSNSQRESKP